MSESNREIAEKLYSLYMGGNVDHPDGLTPILEALDAKDKEREEAVKKAYSMGRDVTGEKTYEDGVREAAEIAGVEKIPSLSDAPNLYEYEPAILVISAIEATKKSIKENILNLIHKPEGK